MKSNSVLSKTQHTFLSLATVTTNLLIANSLFASGSIPEKQKPNVIIVITDDQGTGDLACEGNPYIKTPNIDKFYGDAVRFTNYHVSTTCAPSRGSIMTGRHSNRINTFHTITGRSLLFEDEVTMGSGICSKRIHQWYVWKMASGR